MALTKYQIDGRPIFDLSDSRQRNRLEEVLRLADNMGGPNESLESRESMLQRFRGVRLITDDNMGTEWKAPPPQP